MKNRIEILPVNLSRKQKNVLTKLPGVHLQATPLNTGSLHLQKTMALLQAEGEQLIWIDADCFILRDVSQLLQATPGYLNIRLRGRAENSAVFSRYYSTNDVHGSIPTSFSSRWAQDVQGRRIPRYNSQCVTNIFSIHRTDLPFIEEWQKLLIKVFPKGYRTVVQRDNLEYFMTDESALSALLCFYEEAPLADSHSHLELSNRVLHFSLHPKPWRFIRSELIAYLKEINVALLWLEREVPNLPRAPLALQLQSVRLWKALNLVRHSLRLPFIFLRRLFYSFYTKMQRRIHSLHCTPSCSSSSPRAKKSSANAIS
jgi:hypothetical protein